MTYSIEKDGLKVFIDGNELKEDKMLTIDDIYKAFNIPKVKMKNLPKSTYTLNEERIKEYLSHLKIIMEAQENKNGIFLLEEGLNKKFHTEKCKCIEKIKG